MDSIRAFVGHSFTAGDENVVGSFLKYFDRISGLGVNFFWQHAEAAEPKVLAEKVLSLIADKNVFIGICTRKEKVIAADALKPTLMPRGYLRAPEEAFVWKTSE